MLTNPKPTLRFGPPIYLVPICVRHEHGFSRGPACYQRMIDKHEAKAAAPIVLAGVKQC